MKKAIAILATLFAVTAFAQDKGKGEPVAVKTTPNPVVAPADSKAKALTAKPSKSTPAKDEKAAAPATKPASK